MYPQNSRVWLNRLVAPQLYDNIKTSVTFDIRRTLHTNQRTMASDRLQLLTADDVVQAVAVTRNVLQTPLRYEEPLNTLRTGDADLRF